eukprot:2293479-Pyramimonas_sp.AAC.2
MELSPLYRSSRWHCVKRSRPCCGPLGPVCERATKMATNLRVRLESTLPGLESTADGGKLTGPAQRARQEPGRLARGPGHGVLAHQQAHHGIYIYILSFVSFDVAWSKQLG